MLNPAQQGEKYGLPPCCVFYWAQARPLDRAFPFGQSYVSVLNSRSRLTSGKKTLRMVAASSHVNGDKPFSLFANVLWLMPMFDAITDFLTPRREISAARFGYLGIYIPFRYVAFLPEIWYNSSYFRKAVHIDENSK